jgi:hypothetical protein
VLRDLLQSADIVLNLRNPHYGESSWSLLESLLLGKTTVVWKHGYYDEISDDAVVKISAAEQLDRVLESLVDSPRDRAIIGRRAGEYARSRFSTEKYCETLLSFVAEAKYYRPFLELATSMRPTLDAFGVGPEAAADVRRVIRDEICAMIARRLDIPTSADIPGVTNSDSTAETTVAGPDRNLRDLHEQAARMRELSAEFRVREEETWRREVALREQVDSFHTQVVDLLKREAEAWRREVALREQLEEARTQLADLHASFVEVSSRTAELQQQRRTKKPAPEIEPQPQIARGNAPDPAPELEERLMVLSRLLEGDLDVRSVPVRDLRREVERVRQAGQERDAELHTFMAFHADLVRTRGWRVLQTIRRLFGRGWR